MIENVDYPKDENIPKVTITYRNDNEKTNTMYCARHDVDTFS